MKKKLWIASYNRIAQGPHILQWNNSNFNVVFQVISINNLHHFLLYPTSNEKKLVIFCNVNNFFNITALIFLFGNLIVSGGSSSKRHFLDKLSIDLIYQLQLLNNTCNIDNLRKKLRLAVNIPSNLYRPGISGYSESIYSFVEKKVNFLLKMRIIFL